MKLQPPLDPDFLPMVEYEQSYIENAKRTSPLYECRIALYKSSCQVAWQRADISLSPHLEQQTLFYLNRLIKSMLWIYGGFELYLNLPRKWLVLLQEMFSPCGIQAFDASFIVEKIFSRKLKFFGVPVTSIPSEKIDSSPLSITASGCRLGLDLGGSDQKIAVLNGNQVLHVEAMLWDPYCQKNLNWHKQELQSLILFAKSKARSSLQSVGASVPGIVLDNKMKVSSIFRSVMNSGDKESASLLEEIVHATLGTTSFRLANDGDVTALVGSKQLKKNNLLGIAMGTSQAGGYINHSQSLNSWFSELAFVPIDAGTKRVQEAWSHDYGVGSQYFSQDAVFCLAKKMGIELPLDKSKAEQLEYVQSLLALGNKPVRQIFETIGCYLGYTIPWYHRFYQMDHILLLGRVMKGLGGEIIIAKSTQVLQKEFPQLEVHICTLDDSQVIYGQAIAAASLLQSK